MAQRLGKARFYRWLSWDLDGFPWRGLSRAMQQFPLLTAARLLEGGLRSAAAAAKELLLEGSEAVAPRIPPVFAG